MKYRIWDKVNKKYLDNDFYVVDCDGDICKHEYEGIKVVRIAISNQQNYIIEQSIGIKDINGVELYVGDIVKLNLKYIDQYITVEIRYDNIAQVKVHDIIEKIGAIHDKE